MCMADKERSSRPRTKAPVCVIKQLFAISITMFAFSLLALLFLFIGVYRWRYKNEPLLIRRAQERVLPSDGVEMTTAVV